MLHSLDMQRKNVIGSKEIDPATKPIFRGPSGFPE